MIHTDEHDVIWKFLHPSGVLVKLSEDSTREESLSLELRDLEGMRVVLHATYGNVHVEVIRVSTSNESMVVHMVNLDNELVPEATMVKFRNILEVEVL